MSLIVFDLKIGLAFVEPGLASARTIDEARNRVRVQFDPRTIGKLRVSWPPTSRGVGLWARCRKILRSCRGKQRRLPQCRPRL